MLTPPKFVSLKASFRKKTKWEHLKDWKLFQEIWGKIGMTVQRKVLLSCKFWARDIAKSKAIEQNQIVPKNIAFMYRN